MLFMCLILLLTCYLLGSFPSGYLVAKRLKGIDLRTMGSGSTGTTNAFRALGAKGAIVVLLLDVLKGYLAVQLAYVTLLPDFIFPLVQLLFGFVCIVGHTFSVFTGFKGGKGVAPAFGVLLAMAPQATLMAFLLWIAVVACTRIVSVASITAGIALPLLMIVYHVGTIYVVFGLVVSSFVIYQHRSNISRLMKGEEKPLDF